MSCIFRLQRRKRRRHRPPLPFPMEGILAPFGGAPLKNVVPPPVLFFKKENGPRPVQEKNFLPNRERLILTGLRLSPFAAIRVCLRLSPRSPLTLSAGAAISGRPPPPSLPRQGSAQRSGQRGKRSSNTHRRRKVISLVEKGRTFPTGKSALETGPPPEPSAAGPMGRGGAAQRGSSAAGGGATDAQLVPTRTGHGPFISGPSAAAMRRLPSDTHLRA